VKSHIAKIIHHRRRSSLIERVACGKDVLTSMTTPGTVPPDDGPRGTVVIVAIFGGLLVLGWLAFFFGLFVPRGTH
jgi:hypothetical protein